MRVLLHKKTKNLHSSPPPNSPGRRWNWLKWRKGWVHHEGVTLVSGNLLCSRLHRQIGQKQIPKRMQPTGSSTFSILPCLPRKVGPTQKKKETKIRKTLAGEIKFSFPSLQGLTLLATQDHLLVIKCFFISSHARSIKSNWWNQTDNHSLHCFHSHFRCRWNIDLWASWVFLT